MGKKSMKELKTEMEWQSGEEEETLVKKSKIQRQTSVFQNVKIYTLDRTVMIQWIMNRRMK